MKINVSKKQIRKLKVEFVKNCNDESPFRGIYKGKQCTVITQHVNNDCFLFNVISDDNTYEVAITKEEALEIFFETKLYCELRKYIKNEIRPKKLYSSK